MDWIPSLREWDFWASVVAFFAALGLAVGIYRDMDAGWSAPLPDAHHYAEIATPVAVPPYKTVIEPPATVGQAVIMFSPIPRQAPSIQFAAQWCLLSAKGCNPCLIQACPTGMQHNTN